jgi:hypothetical protein
MVLFGILQYVLRVLSAVVRCSWCLVAGNEWGFGRWECMHKSEVLYHYSE